MWTNRYPFKAPLVTVDRLASKSNAEKLAVRGTSARISSASRRVKVSRSNASCSNPDSDRDRSAPPPSTDDATSLLLSRGSLALKTGSAKTASSLDGRFLPRRPPRRKAMVEAEGRFTISLLTTSGSAGRDGDERTPKGTYSIAPEVKIGRAS